MKINWGTGIVIALVLFAAMLTYYMIRGAQNPSDLVTEDYYEQEIKYQDRIDYIKNAQELGALQVEKEAGQLRITFPVGFNNSDASGKIHFYRPNNAAIDFEVPLKLDANNEQIFDVSKVVQGRWVLKTQLQASGKNYYWEDQITL